MLSGINNFYRLIPNLNSWDFYDLNWGDDIQEAVTAFTDGVAQNWILPFPADAEDPDEAIIVKELHTHALDNWQTKANNGILDKWDAVNADTKDFLTIYFGYFEFDEVDETSAAYRDELKETLGHINLNSQFDMIAAAITKGTAKTPVFEGLLEFASPMIFPLNISAKSWYAEVGGAGAPLRDPTDLNTRIYYRVVRNPLDFLGRILALMRQELSG